MLLSALMLSFNTVITKKIKDQEKQSWVYILTERAIVSVEVILWLCCSQALCTLQKSKKIFLEKSSPVQQGSTESILMQIFNQ